nr:unnamed protein product [Callosobruchus chinensis]
MMSKRDPVKLNHSCWLTTAIRILGLYVATESPSEPLIALATFIMKVYAPMWFSIKAKPFCVNGAKHLFQAIELCRYLPKKLKHFINPLIQRNGYFGHPENLLLDNYALESFIVTLGIMRFLLIVEILNDRSDKILPASPKDISRDTLCGSTVCIGLYAIQNCFCFDCWGHRPRKQNIHHPVYQVLIPGRHCRAPSPAARGRGPCVCPLTRYRQFLLLTPFRAENGRQNLKRMSARSGTDQRCVSEMNEAPCRSDDGSLEPGFGHVICWAYAAIGIADVSRTVSESRYAVSPVNAGGACEPSFVAYESFLINPSSKYCSQNLSYYSRYYFP